MAFFGSTNDGYAALYRYIKIKGIKTSWGWKAVYLNDKTRLNASDGGRMQLELQLPDSKMWHYISDDTVDGPWASDVRKLAQIAIETEYDHYRKAENQMFKTDRFEKLDLE